MFETADTEGIEKCVKHHLKSIPVEELIRVYAISFKTARSLH